MCVYVSSVCMCVWLNICVCLHVHLCLYVGVLHPCITLSLSLSLPTLSLASLVLSLPRLSLFLPSLPYVVPQDPDTGGVVGDLGPIEEKALEEVRSYVLVVQVPVCSEEYHPLAPSALFP